MNGHRENMLTLILTILLCVVPQCSIADAIAYDQFCQHYPALLQYQSEPHSGLFSFFFFFFKYLLEIFRVSLTDF